MVRVFFSYSHRDETLRNELEIHLSALKRQGVIETWHDRRIGAGEDLATEIDANLERADIILLLVSPYFIASDYCYNVEMQRAMERHQRNEARVIPVILHPCEWHYTPFGKLRATPPDGKPVSKFPNQHDAFLAVTKDIRCTADEMVATISIEEDQVKPLSPVKREPSERKPRSSNLRVRREFTDIEKSQFLSETLDYLANFFENSLSELEARGSGIKTESRKIDANRFTAAIYRGGKLISQCTIWLAVDDYSFGEIRYSSSRSLHDNSWNEWVTVQDDGYTLGLSPMGMHRHLSQDESILTQEGAAELFWSMLIEHLQ
ncbi:MAG: toll/interleukin-1 receptor domain-containing protein [Candidatus Hodarchaeota archaeon]